MLKANSDRNLPSVDVGEADEFSGAELFANALGLVRRQIFVVLLFAAVGACLGTVFFVKVAPNYTAVATLLVDTRRFEILKEPAISSQIPIESMGAMESQVELLKSDEVALAVIKKFQLWQDPRFVADKGGIVQTLLHNLFPQSFGEQPPRTDDERMQLALDKFSRDLTVGRVGITYAIEIGFESKYPDLAAQVANGVVDAYVGLQQTSEFEAAHQASDWLETRIPELRAKSEAAQRAVVDYKNEYNIVETGSGQLVSDQHLADLRSKLDAARDETLKLKASVDQLAAIGSGEIVNSVVGISKSESADSDVLNKLRSQYFEIVSKEVEASAKYGTNSPTIVGLRNQKDQLSSEILGEANRLKQLRTSEYAAAELREGSVKKEFDAAVLQTQASSQAQVKLPQLEASARAYQDLYNTFLNRYNASLQQTISPSPGASVITRATSLDEKGYKRGKTAILLPIAGLVLGIGVGLLRELFAGRTFRTSKSVQSRLHVPCIGVLPKWREPSKRSRGASGPRSIVRGNSGISWAVVDYPLSRFSEGVRSIKLAIDLDSRIRSAKVIGFTSAVPDEGKSTIALAVGQLMARNGAAVIVVDCDLRNPSLTRSVAPDATMGIIDLVAGRADLRDVVWKDRSTQMEFLPAVPRIGPPDPPTILAGVELTRVFDELRKHYEYVLVDLSPLAPVIDVCATVELIDSYVLVIGWGGTNIDVVEHALRAAPSVAESIVGAVLNKADLKQLAKYDPYLTGYYFGRDR
jgi:polysaccharide biosynthesis transport protein